jgi:DNA-binding protein HU-beta
MTKAEVVAQISAKTGTDKVMVQDTLEHFFKVVKNSMIAGQNVYFRGFGSFIVKKRAKKIARNIAKNTTIVVNEHYTPRFKPSKSFMEKVRKNHTSE